MSSTAQKWAQLPFLDSLAYKLSTERPTVAFFGTEVTLARPPTLVSIGGGLVST